MSRGLGKCERALLERVGRDWGIDSPVPVVPDGMDASSSEAASLRRAAHSLERKGLVRLYIGQRRGCDGKNNNGCPLVGGLFVMPVALSGEDMRRAAEITEGIRVGFAIRSCAVSA